MTFNYSITNTITGLSAAQSALIQSDLINALSDYSSVLGSVGGTLSVQLNSSPNGVTTNQSGYELAFNSSPQVSTNTTNLNASGFLIEPTAANYLLTTGQHASSSQADVIITLNMSYLSQFNLIHAAGSPTGYDLVSLFRHELGQSFGFSGYLNTTTGANSYGNVQTQYDSYVKQINNVWYFTGPNAELLNGGNPVALESSLPGSNIYYVGNGSNDSNMQDVMFQALPTAKNVGLSALDLAIFKDIGLTVTGSAPAVGLNQTAIPSPVVPTGTAVVSAATSLTVGADTVAGFDAAYYLQNNPDVLSAAQSLFPTSASQQAAFALQHYTNFGWHEGRNPNQVFNTNYYLKTNSDVAAAGINPLAHYESFGWQENRTTSATFNETHYLTVNPDIKLAGVNPMDHYLVYGQFEGRST